jgi:hypothetical protein
MRNFIVSTVCAGSGALIKKSPQGRESGHSPLPATVEGAPCKTGGFHKRHLQECRSSPSVLNVAVRRAATNFSQPHSITFNRP